MLASYYIIINNEISIDESYLKNKTKQKIKLITEKKGNHSKLKKTFQRIVGNRRFLHNVKVSDVIKIDLIFGLKSRCSLPPKNVIY